MASWKVGGQLLLSGRELSPLQQVCDTDTASSELLCAAVLPLPAKDSGSFAKLPSHKRNHFCRSSSFFFFFALKQLDTHKRTPNTHPHTKHKPQFHFQELFILMGSILLFGWNLIIHIMPFLQPAQSFPCIRQLWHSVYCHCRQCLMVSLLFFNLCCDEGLPLLHLVWSSVGIDWQLKNLLFDFQRKGEGGEPWGHVWRDLAVLWLSPQRQRLPVQVSRVSVFQPINLYIHIFYTILSWIVWVRYTDLHTHNPLHLAPAYYMYWNMWPA